MLEALPPREREIADLLYELGEATVSELRVALADPLTDQAVRAMLARLEGKGFVHRKQTETGLVFSPALPAETVRVNALRRMVRAFFKGSPVRAVSALLGMAGHLSEDELDELERIVLQAREARRK